MTKEFKVGDKVCHIGFGNGVVESINDQREYQRCVRVKFDGKISGFRYNGKYLADDENPSLFHGHGTFQFIPEPEPEYTWQWLYFCNVVKRYWASHSFYKSEEDFIRTLSYTPKWYQRIEESKKEI
jgi:hypothetical protein